MFGGFQPPQLIQLACDQGVKAFFGQTSVFGTVPSGGSPFLVDWTGLKICCASIFAPVDLGFHSFTGRPQRRAASAAVHPSSSTRQQGCGRAPAGR